MRDAGATWANIKASLGIQNTTLTCFLRDLRCIECGAQLVREGAARCHPCANRERVVWTKEKIRYAISSFFIENGRPPKAKECRSEQNLPSYVTIRNEFGSFTEAIRFCGLTPRKTGAPAGGSHRSRKSPPAALLTEEQELQALIREQLNDIRTSGRVFRPSVDALDSFWQGRTRAIATDGWTEAVHALVDSRREIDALCEQYEVAA